MILLDFRFLVSTKYEVDRKPVWQALPWKHARVPPGSYSDWQLDYKLWTDPSPQLQDYFLVL